jgi:hypothetical protein
MVGFEIAAVFGCFFGVLSFLISLYNLIENRAAAESTHQVQYVDVPFPGTKVDEFGFEELTEEVKDKIKTTDDDPDFGWN